MDHPILLSLPGNERMTQQLAEAMGGEIGVLVVRRFPDGETYVRLESPCADRDVLLVCSLARPDDKLAPLLFAAATIREMNARRIGLVTPYLAYLRQDRRFQPGEALTSRYVADLLSRYVDSLVTVDPHLHRYASLDAVYLIPTFVAHSAALLAAWIQREVARPLLIGPDSESAQWVADVAARAGAPHVVASKVRRDDRTVDVTIPDIDRHRDRAPVLIDDIISTGRTMTETMRRLQDAGLPQAVCVGVHAVFAGGAYEELLAAGAARVVTCDTIPHPTNGIPIMPILVPAVRDSLSAPPASRAARRP
jgi:ribose-phosphate pyrophosphokinase